MQACKHARVGIFMIFTSLILGLFILQIYLSNYSNIHVASKHVMDALKGFTNVP